VMRLRHARPKSLLPCRGAKPGAMFVSGEATSIVCGTTRAKRRQVVRQRCNTPPNFTLKLPRPGFGPAAELPCVSASAVGGTPPDTLLRRHPAAQRCKASRRTASARGPWPRSLA
jgi:hypothetical protein